MNMTVTQAELAEIIGVNIRTIQRLTQEGLLEATPDPGDRRRKVFALPAAVQAYLEYRMKQGESGERSARISVLEEKKLAAETELKESQRDLHILKTDIASGKYLPIDQVQLDYSRFFIVLKKFLFAIPNRVSGIVAGMVDPVTARGIEKDLAHDLENTLRAFVVAGTGGESGGQN